MSNPGIYIIGGGPAGIAAAVYLKRFSHEVTLIEPNPMVGGQIMIPNVIENYLGFPDGINGFDFASVLQQQIQKLSITILNNKCNTIQLNNNTFILSLDNQEQKEADYVIVAMGTKNKPLNIPGEKEWTGRGVSTCATCDAPFFKGKTVAVIGGGDTALTETIYLSTFAKEIHLFHRRNEFRGFSVLADRIKNNPKVTIHYSCKPQEIHGDKTVDSITFLDGKTNNSNKIPVDGVFVFAGYEPDASLCKQFVDLDTKGYIKTNVENETKTPNLYAIGDIRSKSLRQIVTAMSDGAVTANNIHHKILMSNP